MAPARVAAGPDLAGLPGLNAVPAEWLHLTVQSVGFVDEIPDATVPDVVDAVRAEAARLPAFDLACGTPMIGGEAIAIPAGPVEPLHRLLAAVRAGIAAALGPDAVRASPEQARGFHPHVSIAYSRIEADAAPYATALAAVDRPPASVPVTAVTLIRQDRLLGPDWLYRWTTEATAPLGG